MYSSHAFAYRVKQGYATYDAAGDLEPTTHADATYRRLWLTVVLRAVEEARGVNCLTDRRTTVHGLKGAARQWLTHDTPDLRLVCAFAGVDADELLRVYGGKYGPRSARH